MKYKKKLLIAIIILLFFLLVRNYNNRINSLNNLVNRYAEKIEKLETVDVEYSQEVNNDFLEKFFTYDTLLEKYNNTFDLMTDEVKNEVFPNGSELLADTFSSKIISKDIYVNIISKDKVVFFNEVIVEINGSDFVTTSKYFLKTTLIAEREAWVVYALEYVNVNAF